MSTNWQSVCIGTAFAVFIVWMERKGRWSLFAGAAGGDYQLANTRKNSSTNGSSAPNYSGNASSTQQSTNQTINSLGNPNPPAQTTPFLGGVPGATGSGAFNATPPHA